MPLTAHAHGDTAALRRYLAPPEIAAVGGGRQGLAALLRARLELRALEVQLLLGRAREVLAAGERLAAAFDPEQLPELVGDCWGLLIEALLMRSEYARMEELSRRAIDLHQRRGDRAKAASRLNGLGVAVEDTGRPEQGLECYRQALALYRQLGDIDGIGNSLVNVASVLGALGRDGEAERTFQDAIATLERGTDLVTLAYAYSNYSVLLARLGRREEARACLERSRAIRERVGDRYGLGFSLSNIAVDLIQSGAWPAGERMLAEAIALRRGIGDRMFLAGDLLSLGALRRDQLRLEEARILLQQAAAMGRELANGGLAAAAHLRLAAVHCDQERWAEAERCLEDAHAAAAGSRDRPLARLVSARCAAGTGDRDGAQALLERLAAEDGPWQADALLLLAVLMAAAGRPGADVERAFERAIGSARRDESCYRAAVAQFRYAEWLKAAGRPWETAVAAAEQVFGRLGAAAWTERIRLLHMV
ncbi:MAG: tetratricopeptide repeat protein [Candidatus Edwardsbacteria bacterium]|nr:tetratricopeptide repeat protein [Candidatus Edwardsbacteria bacterium]